MTNLDFDGCEEHFKSIHRAFLVLTDRQAKDNYNQYRLERAKEDYVLWWFFFSYTIQMWYSCN